MTLDPSPSSDTASTSARPSCASSPPKTIVAVAGIRRKLNSKAMQTVLSEMRHMHEDDFEIIQLDEDMMNNRPVNQWPTAHVLLTLYSPTFPLQKVLRYISLRSPLLINNLHMQPAMMDRRLIRRVLKRAGVPIPPAIYLDRSAGDTVTQSGHNQNVLVIDSPCRCSTFSIEKPFVEKPVDPEDHSTFPALPCPSFSYLLFSSLLPCERRLEPLFFSLFPRVLRNTFIRTDISSQRSASPCLPLPVSLLSSRTLIKSAFDCLS